VYIKDAARALGVSVRTIKRWIDKGLIPDVERNYNGWRIFTDEDISKIRESFLSKRKTPYLTAIDLFSGCGGLSEGFRSEGFKILWANDVLPEEAATYRTNHPETIFDQGDIRNIDPCYVLDATGFKESELDVIIGGPPCQGFSINAPRREMTDPRNTLFMHYIRFVNVLRPRFIVFENVPGLLSLDGGAALDNIYHELSNIGYVLMHKILLAAHYGVPQERWRLIIVGTRLNNSSFTFPIPLFHSDARANFRGGKTLVFQTTSDNLDAPPTINDAISDLIMQPLSINGDPLPYVSAAMSKYQQMLRVNSNQLFNHVSARISDVNIMRLKHINPGGNWTDIPFDLLPAGMKRARRSDHTKRYGRMDLDQLSCTILTKCDPHWGCYFHPIHERVISVREAARIQSFPDHYRFEGSVTAQYRQVGNAVPPLMAASIAREVKRSLLIS